MASEKDIQLIEQLIEATNANRISWEPTAALGEFTTSFKGKYSVVVQNRGDEYTLLMLDDFEREMLRLQLDVRFSPSQNNPPSIKELFDLARRKALHVDEVLDDILHELKS